MSTPELVQRSSIGTNTEHGRDTDLKTASTTTTTEISSDNEGSSISSCEEHKDTFASAEPWLVASPYLEPEHQLDLSMLDHQNQLLAIALVHLTSATSSYATTTYSVALNWPTVFSELKQLSLQYNHNWTEAEFYVVEFRSKLKPRIDNELLFKLDKESHREATASGGLLKYWFGEPDNERRNLATCLWRSKADAVAGGKGPWHKRARDVTSKMYESIEVRGLRLTIEDEVDSWRFERWD